MRKIVSMFALAVAFVLASGVTFAADEEKKEKAKKDRNTVLLDKLFEKMDADRDGLISREEFKKFQEERGKATGKGEKVAGVMAARFDKLDANSDGYLSREELLKARDQLVEGVKSKEKMKDKKKKKE